MNTEVKKIGPAESAHGVGMKRRMLLDWHLVVASLATVALLNWSADAQTSDGSMVESQRTVVRTKIDAIARRVSGPGRVEIVLPSALNSRTVALAETQQDSMGNATPRHSINAYPSSHISL